METILNSILQWFKDCVLWLVRVVKSIIYAAIDFFEDSVCWLVDKPLDWVVEKLEAVDIPLSNYKLQTLIDALPTGVVDILAVLAVPQALTLLGACYVIRFVLQLIPFVRLGS